MQGAIVPPHNIAAQSYAFVFARGNKDADSPLFSRCDKQQNKTKNKILTLPSFLPPSVAPVKAQPVSESWIQTVLLLRELSSSNLLCHTVPTDNNGALDRQTDPTTKLSLLVKKMDLTGHVTFNLRTWDTGNWISVIVNSDASFYIESSR